MRSEVRCARRGSAFPVAGCLLLVALTIIGATSRPKAAQAEAHPGQWGEAALLPDATTGKSVQLSDGRVFRVGGKSTTTLAAAIFNATEGGHGEWTPVAIPSQFNGTLGTVELLTKSRFRCGAGCVLVRTSDGTAPWAIYSDEEGWKFGPDDIAQPDPVTLEGPTVTALEANGPLCGLNCGKVLVVGGTHDSGGLTCGGGSCGMAQMRAQLYDPVANLWTPTDSPTGGRVDSAAVVMAGPKCGVRCGQVLVIGGGGKCLPHAWVCIPSGITAEFFDPLTGSFSPAPPPRFPHYGHHTATVMNDGRVLVGDYPQALAYLPLEGQDNHAEVFDPSANGGAGEWIATENDCGVCRPGHSATSLPNGKVLAVGPKSDGNLETSDRVGAQLYDPLTNSWTPAPAPSVRSIGHSNVLLEGSRAQCGRHCGKVLAAGGVGTDEGAEPLVRTSELFAPAPIVDRIVPASGSTKGGTHVVVAGTGLASASAHNAAFAGVAAVACGDHPSSACYPDPDSPDSKLHVITPRHPEGRADFSVTTDGGLSNRVPFTFELPLPVLTGVLPACGPVGAEFPVTLTGEHLDVVDNVRFAGNSTQGSSNADGTAMDVLVPAQTTGGKLEATVASRGRISGPVSLTIPCPVLPSLVAGSPPAPGTGGQGGAGNLSPVVNVLPVGPAGTGTPPSGASPQVSGPPPGGFIGGSTSVSSPPVVHQTLGSQVLQQAQVQNAPSSMAAPTPPVLRPEENLEPGSAARYAMVAANDPSKIGLLFIWGALLLTGFLFCATTRAVKGEPDANACPAFGAPGI